MTTGPHTPSPSPAFHRDPRRPDVRPGHGGILRAARWVGWLSAVGIGLATSAAPATNRLEAPPALLVTRPIELLPPFPRPPVLEPIAFPATDPMARVQQLAWNEDRLWISARPRGDTNLAAGDGRLWTFSPVPNRIEPVRGALSRDGVRDIRPRTDGVWVAVEGGVVAIDPQTFVFDPFSAPQGITSRQLVGFAAAGRRLLTLAEAGNLFELKPDGRNWRRIDPPAPSLNPREPVRWRRTAGSADWILALGAAAPEVSFRQLDSPQWGQPRDEALALIPRPDAPAWTAVVGDQGGGFWIGSDAGLHLLVAETGSMEHRVSPLRSTVAGGWGQVFGPHLGPTPAMHAEIISRQTDDIRRRMRDRVRLARIAKDLRIPLDPITPVSRIPGAVRALAMDGPLLWVATADPSAPERSRILLLHAASRKWLGWFGVGRPVMAMATDASHLYLGTDVENAPAAVPLLRVAKAPLLAVPETRRVADHVTPEELGPKLAALPLKERAVLAFFAGDARTVTNLLANAPRPDAETLFLLAFAHDAIGLDEPLRQDAYLDALQAGFPESPLALAVAGLRPARGPVARPESLPAAAPPSPPSTASPGAASPTASPTPSPAHVPTVAEILARRDLNRDGRLNRIEFRLWRGPRADIQPYDRDGDGKLDAVELEAVLRDGPADGR